MTQSQMDASRPSGGTLRVLSLALPFPNPREPGLGGFIRSRLQALGKRADVTVMAPVPCMDYSSPAGMLTGSREVPRARTEGKLNVLHPRWLYPPGGTVLNVLCLALRLIPVVSKLQRQRRIQVLDAHFGYPEGAAAALLAWIFKIPFTVTLRGNEIVFARQRMRRFAMKAGLQRAAKVIAVSEELRELATALGVPEQRTCCIPNGVETRIFSPRDRKTARQNHGIPARRLVIVSGGELIEAKGHQHVAEAVRDLAADGLDVQLIIVGATARGGPKFEAELRAYVSSLNVGDRIRFFGWASPDTMAELLSAADVFCLASYTEGWPNVVHEALACGAPVVATEVGAIPQMIPSADYGFTVPVKDQTALREALRTALAKEWQRDQIARRGGARTWDQVAAEVHQAFEEIVAGGLV